MINATCPSIQTFVLNGILLYNVSADYFRKDGQDDKNLPRN